MCLHPTQSQCGVRAAKRLPAPQISKEQNKPELKVSRGRRDRAIDGSNLLRRALRAREASRVDYPVACMQKIAEDLEMKSTSLPICWISKQCQGRQGKRQDTCMWVRGGRRVCVFCASACLFEKGRGLWQPLNSHRKATFYSELNRHQIQHKNTHTSTLCTHKRYSPNSIKFHYSTLLEDMFVV